MKEVVFRWPDREHVERIKLTDNQVKALARRRRQAYETGLDMAYVPRSYAHEHIEIQIRPNGVPLGTGRPSEKEGELVIVMACDHMRWVSESLTPGKIDRLFA